MRSESLRTHFILTSFSILCPFSFILHTSLENFLRSPNELCAYLLNIALLLAVASPIWIHTIYSSPEREQAAAIVARVGPQYNRIYRTISSVLLSSLSQKPLQIILQGNLI
jgi:hypothetical protein